MQKIAPMIWFNNNAEEAVELYMSCLENAKINNITRFTKAGFEIHQQPEGRAMTVQFELEGYSMVALNGGPQFPLNPSVSFFISCTTKEQVDEIWKKLSAGGKIMMDLGSYPFSERYGWVQDKYGVSWQVMYMGERKIEQKIIPALMFTGQMAGRAEEAIDNYVSIFHNSSKNYVMRYEKGEEPDKEGTIKHASFILEGQQFAAMDSALDHGFSFNESISFMVSCKDQEEIDYFWDKLSDGGDPQAQQCGWLRDRYGVAWQIVPSRLDEMMQDKDTAKVERVTNAFMQMKKLNIAELEKVYNG